MESGESDVGVMTEAVDMLIFVGYYIPVAGAGEAKKEDQIASGRCTIYGFVRT